MKRKLLLWLAIASVSTVAWATESTGASGTIEPEAMNVHRWDATIRSTMLDNVQTIRFSDDETEMLIWTIDQQSLSHGIPDILKVTFGDYLADNETTPVETLLHSVSDNTRKFLENGNLVIIKNGVRYSILGMRL